MRVFASFVRPSVSVIAGLLCGILSCTTPTPAPVDLVETQSLKIFTSKDLHKSSEAPQCKFLLDSYCNYLYSPESLGNLEIKNTQSSMKVLQGETSNGFSQVFYQYSRAKIQNEKHLPRDFRRILQQHNYFSRLQVFLDRQVRATMSVQQRLDAERLDYELGSIWHSSINETILKRIIKKYPGYHQMPSKMVPIELSLEKRRLRRNLISEISQAIWRDNKKWKGVEQGFQRLQKNFLHVISKLDIPENVRADWTKRILEVRLVLPGSFPAISDEECSTTTSNAYYYTYLNVLTVCAGDFNSEDIIQTLAHEMGHALGIDRTQYLYQTESKFGQELGSFRSQICRPKVFSCEKWEDYKKNFSTQLTSLEGFQPDLPEFQSCLKRRATSKSLTPEVIQRFAKNIVSDRISGLASSDRFLRITKSQIPKRNGALQKNPNYLNPCSYYMWSMGEEPIDDELTTLMYFTAEYRCSDKPSLERMKSAIEIAKSMSEKVLEKTLQIEGEYSARSALETEGYSSPNFERFADVIGSYAMADLLLEIPSAWERQNKFLASSSWQCREPSLATHFPEESAIEKEYIFEAHTEGDQRKKEIFTTPIRNAISCEKDFEFKECQIPFKK